jgi:hypothetical protein
MRFRAGLAAIAFVIAACGSPNSAPTPSTVAIAPIDEAEPMPPGGAFQNGEIGPNGETTFSPVSAEIDDDVTYVFALGHCGLISPVDVDGSFWDVVAAHAAGGTRVDPDAEGELINQTQGAIVVRGDRAYFRTPSGIVVTFERHDGPKAFPGCA